MRHDDLNTAAPRKGRGFLLRGAMVAALCVGLAACKSKEERADEYYESAMQLLAQGDTDRAAVQLRNVFDIKGDHYEARKALAELLVTQGQATQAYSQYLRLAEQYPDDLDTRVALARLAYRAQHYDELERHTGHAERIAPDDPRVKALTLVGRYRAAVRGQREEDRATVVAEAEALLQTLPDDPLLLEILLDQAARDKSIDKATPLVEALIRIQPDNIVHYRQKLALLVELGDLAGAEAHLAKTIETFPDDTQAKADLLQFYLMNQRVDDAEAFLRKLAAEAPEGDNAQKVDLVRFIEMQRGVAAARTELDRILAEGGDPQVFGTLKAGYDFVDGKRDEAIAALRGLIEGAEPTDQTRAVQVQLARMLWATGARDEALALADTVLATDLRQAGALKLKAEDDIASDRADDAIARLRTALDQSPEDVQALMLMSDAYTRAGDADLSREFLARAASASRDNPMPVLALADRLASEKRWRPAEDALVDALRRMPDNVALLNALGRVYIAMPDLPRADGVIRRLRELDTPEAKAGAEALDLARLAQKEGQGAAMARLEELAREAGNDQTAQMQLIRARMLTGDSKGALDLAQRLMADHPDQPALGLVVALAQANAGEFDAAEASYRAAITAMPDSAAPYVELYRMQSMLGKNDAAMATLDQGLAAHPEDGDLLWGQASRLEREGQIDAAIAIYDRLYAMNSNAVLVANNLASLLATYKSDDPAALERAATVSRRLQGTTVPPMMDTYGWILHLNGKSADAIPYLEGAAKALPDDPNVQLHLGLALAAAGNPSDAIAQLEKALAMPAAAGAEGRHDQARAVLDGLKGAGGAGAATAPVAAQPETQPAADPAGAPAAAPAAQGDQPASGTSDGAGGN